MTLPWRVKQCNTLDIALHIMMSVFTGFAGLFVKNDGGASDAGMVLLVALFIVIAALLVVVFIGIYTRFGATAKMFKFFLCHHKADAGSFTRLLQMELSENKKIKGGVFIDSEETELVLE